MTFHTLNELIADGVRGRYILVRSDLNVPLDGSEVTDDGRIKASLPVLTKLTDAGARVLVTAHLGRPKGAPEEKYSLKPAVTRLAELASFKVALAGDTVGASAKELAASLQDGEALVLENVRFDARETSKDDAERGAFADELVALTGDNGAFVDDAFGAVHRKHASVYDVATRLPSYQGDLVHTEVEVLRKLTTETQRPYVVVLGGSKVSDKLAVIDNLIGKADTILVGGGMLFTFLAAEGHKVAGSLLEEDQIPVVQDYLKRAADAGTEFVVPTDVVVAAKFAADADHERSALTLSRAAASAHRASAWTSDPNRQQPSPAGSRVPRPCSGTAPWVSSNSKHLPAAPVPSRSRLLKRMPSLWWAAVIPQPPSVRWASLTTSSATSPRVAAPAWSTSKARNCRDSASWTARSSSRQGAPLK